MHVRCVCLTGLLPTCAHKSPQAEGLGEAQGCMYLCKGVRFFVPSQHALFVPKYCPVVSSCPFRVTCAHAGSSSGSEPPMRMLLPCSIGTGDPMLLGLPQWLPDDHCLPCPGTFEVSIITPPPHSLGIHALPQNTHNGDQIEVNGSDYVVSSVVLQYKLVGGRYRREHNRLEVQQTGRYFLNMHLQSLLDGPDSQAS